MNKSDLSRNKYMLTGPLATEGYDWWWHSFTGVNPQTGEKKAFFVEFYIINPLLSPEKVVLGQLTENQATGKKPSYAMLNVGTWGKNKKQLHAFFPLNSCKINAEKLDVRFENNRLTEKRMTGEVKVTREQAQDKGYMCDEGEMSFDLRISKKVAFNVGYGANSFFRWLNAFEMFWHAEGMKTIYAGKVCIDGETYIVDPKTCNGYADKNWGKNYTSPWVWFSSWNLKSRISGRQLKNSVFDIGGGRPKVFGIPLDRKLLIDVFYEGKDYEYNFSKIFSKSKILFNCFETANEIVWEIDANNHHSRMRFVGKCQKAEMIKIHYEAPDGTMLHKRLWNGGTGYGRLTLYDERGRLIDDIDVSNAGCEYGEYSR